MSQPLSLSDDEHADLQKLRELLSVPESTRLDHLEELLNTPELHANEVAKVLAEAVRIRSNNDNDLGLALEPSIESAITASVSRNPKPLSDALFPVMGPAIRASISNAIASMLQSLNQTLEHSFSPKGLKWRFDALRTGKSFAEVVLLNTLLYRVEQVFLIHKETGLLLHHLSHDPDRHEDADLVSSMLTAVRDFIHDSFDPNSEQEVDNLRMGDLEIIVKQGPEAILAIVCRGSTPKSLQLNVQTIIENIHLIFAKEMQEFSGDNSPFALADELLSPLLVADYSKENDQESSPIKAIIAVAISLIVLFGWMGWKHYSEAQQQAQWQSYINKLNDEPGIIISQIKQTDGIYTLFGLRDPLAHHPMVMLKDFELPKKNIALHLQPYHAMHEPFILQRATSLLAPPATVNISLRHNTLTLSGIAMPNWVTQAKQSALFIAGIDAIDASQLRVFDLHSALLKKATDILNPPASVTLKLSGKKLKVSGSATEAWAKSAAKNIQRLNGIQVYDDHSLVLTDSLSYLLKVAYRALKPPKGVRLSITKSKRLIAKGNASKAWTQQARKRAAKIKGIQGYSDKNIKDPHSDEAILITANNRLHPPSSVLLFFEKGTLFAGGKANSAWFHTFKQKALTIVGVKRYDTSQLLNTTAMWGKLDNQVRDIQIIFAAGRMNFNNSERGKLEMLSNLLYQARLLRPDSQLQVIGLATGKNLGLAFARARYTRSELEKRGMPAAHINATSRQQHSSEQALDIIFSLSGNEGRTP